MGIKRILVPIPDTADPAAEISMALSAASLLEAQVEALYIAEPPPPPPSEMATREAARFGRDSVGSAVLPQADERERHARSTKEAFTRACGDRHVPLESDTSFEALPSALWRQVEGRYATVTVGRAVAFDLIVASSAAVASSLKEIAEATLLETGRPVLLAPLRREASLTGPAIVAWDNSPQCWHAVTAAVPFLLHSTSVQVLSVDQDAAKRQSSHQEVLLYLRCHGIPAQARTVSPRSSPVAQLLLSLAGDEDAGLMVMGAYSHSRWREMLLGGVTRDVLQNAAATPVLMAH